MEKLFLICLLLLVHLAPPVLADEDGAKKYKDFTPEQIKDLPDDVRNSSVPMMYIFAAQAGLAVGSELTFAMYLNSLMYPGLHDYDAAVKAFQTDLGDQPTGALTVSQIHHLQQRAEMQKLGAVIFPDSFSSFITEDFAKVEGTTTILEDKIAYPINHVKVQCYKGDNYCEYNMIALMLPTETSWSQSYHVMDMGTDIYKITRWENDVIDAVPMNDVACRSNSLNFNFKTKEFFEISRNNEGECKFLDANFEKLPKPRISQIVDGKEIIQKEFANIRKKAFEVLASDFQREVKKLISTE